MRSTIFTPAKSSTPKKTSANVKQLSNEDSDDLFAEISPLPANKHSPVSHSDCTL